MTRRIVLTPWQAIVHVLWELWPDLLTGRGGQEWTCDFHQRADGEWFLRAVRGDAVREWGPGSVVPALVASAAPPWPTVAIVWHSGSRGLFALTLLEGPL